MSGSAPHPDPPTAAPTDWRMRKTLIERVAADCQPSWEEFHRAYRGFVASIAGKCGVPPGDIDDLSQAVFIEVHRDLTRPDAPDFGERSFGSWLGQKVKWRVLEYHRHRHRREQATDPAELAEHGNGRPFDEIWRCEWHRRVMETALRRIEEKPRNLLIFQALAIQEMPVGEVCEAFDISRSNADTIKNRVKDKLAPVIREVEAGVV